MKTKEVRIFTQLLNTISHDWKKSYSLSHYWRWRARQVLMQALRQWIIISAAWYIDSWRWREIEFIMQSCFLTKQYLHLRARLMRTQHVWVVAALKRWTQQQHQIIWSLWSIMHQHLLKHAEINLFIKSHEFNLQHQRREKSRRSRRDRRDSDNNARKATKDIHLKKKSRLREHVSMISVSTKLLLIMLMMMMLILLCHSC